MTTHAIGSRQDLLQQIATLQAKLAHLDASSTGTSPDPQPQPQRTITPPPRPKPNPSLNKPTKPLGPLPAALAASPKRHIALLFAYDGWAHSGLAYQPLHAPTPFPTVEGCLLEALAQSRLIEPMKETDGFGCGFERCGRTDAGVSSSNQVVNLWVRSDLEDPMGTAGEQTLAGEARGEGEEPAVQRRRPPSLVELPYIALLNRHLPPTIRILAWSPVSSSFSSRFSCVWRHYKYFFSASPSKPFLGPGSSFDFGAAYAAVGRGGSAWKERLEGMDWRGLEMDVPSMRDGLVRLVGEHDYRNMCKVDPTKQLTTHVRTVVSATIDALEDGGPDMFVLNLRGGAFLYNQVRHIVALLFLIGARLEPPSIISSLLWTSDRTPTTELMNPLAPNEAREEVDRKPGYEMADDLPLVLWKCGFNSAELDWRLDNVPREGDASNTSLSRAIAAVSPTASSSSLAPTPFGSPSPSSRPSSSSTPPPPQPQARNPPPPDPTELFRRQFLSMNELWTEQRLKALVLKHHLAAFASLAPAPSRSPSPTPSSRSSTVVAPVERRIYTPLGSGHSSKTSHYIPLLLRKRGDLPEVSNARWAAGRGRGRMEKRKENQVEADRARVVNLAKKEVAREGAERERVEEEERREREEEEGERRGY